MRSVFLRGTCEASAVEFIGLIIPEVYDTTHPPFWCIILALINNVIFMNVSTQALDALKRELENDKRELQTKEQELKRKQAEFDTKKRELDKIDADLKVIKLSVDQLHQKQQRANTGLQNMQRELEQALKNQKK